MRQPIQTLVNGDTIGPADDRREPRALGADLGTRMRQVRARVAPAGSRISRIQSTQSQNPANGRTMKQNLFHIEDAEIAEVMVKLHVLQAAYKAALEATARAVTPSLTDFLR